MNGTKKIIDQKFAVVGYAIALCVSAVASAIIAGTVDMNSNLYIYLCYLIPQAGYITVFTVNYYRYGYKINNLVEKENVRPLEYLFAIILAVGVLFFALLPNSYVQTLIVNLGSSSTTVVPVMEKWYDYLLCTLTICVLPSIGEELIFRKAFCDGLKDVADYKTILLCALCFSLSHLNLAQTVHQFFFGAILGFVYVKTRNVTLTMIMHFINNALALFLEKITGAQFWTELNVLIISCVVGFVLIVSGIILFLKSGKKIDNKKSGKIEMITIILIVVLVVAWGASVGMSFVK